MVVNNIWWHAFCVDRGCVTIQSEAIHGTWKFISNGINTHGVLLKIDFSVGFSVWDATLVSKPGNAALYSEVLIVWLKLHICSDVVRTSWCVKSPTSRLFVQQFYHSYNKLKETSKSLITGLSKGIPSVTGGFPHKGTLMWQGFPCRDVIMVVIFSMTLTA